MFYLVKLLRSFKFFGKSWLIDNLKNKLFFKFFRFFKKKINFNIQFIILFAENMIIAVVFMV